MNIIRMAGEMPIFLAATWTLAITRDMGDAMIARAVGTIHRWAMAPSMARLVERLPTAFFAPWATWAAYCSPN